jgi:hypothetical protein
VEVRWTWDGGDGWSSNSVLLSLGSYRFRASRQSRCLPVVVVVMVGHDRGPLRALLVPLLAALLGTVDGDVGRCLLAAAWGRLPDSLGRTKVGRLVANGILGGDAAWLLNGVPKNIVVFALVWVLTRDIWVTRPRSPDEPVGESGLNALGLSPQRGPR